MTTRGAEFQSKDLFINVALRYLSFSNAQVANLAIAHQQVARNSSKQHKNGDAGSISFPIPQLSY